MARVENVPVTFGKDLPALSMQILEGAPTYLLAGGTRNLAESATYLPLGRGTPPLGGGRDGICNPVRVKVRSVFSN